MRFPRRFNDFLPVTRTALAHIPSKENRNAPRTTVESISQLGPDLDSLGGESGSEATASSDDSSLDHSDSLVTSNTNCFGIYRIYTRKPVYDPLQNSIHERSAPLAGEGPPHSDMQTMPYYHPFSNPSAAAMMVAHHSGTPLQSIQKTTSIAHILGSLGEDLDPLDLCNFNATLENKKLDSYLTSASGTAFNHEDGWKESSVRFRLPLDKKKMPEADAAEFEVGGVHHRDLVDTIISVYKSDVVRSFDHVPFREFWKPSEDSPPERLYGEIFSSQAMLDADDEIQRLCMDNDSLRLAAESDLEAISVPLLLYSDSTHLASFGTASCWPIYLFIGSQSKYVRDMPTSSACHHIAYMPSVCIIRTLFKLSNALASYQTTFKTFTRNSTKQVQQPRLLHTASGSWYMLYIH